MDDRERRPAAPEEVVSELFFFEEAIFDGNYQGPVFAKDQKKAMYSPSAEIVNGPMLPRASKYCHGAGLLNTLFAWLGRCPRLANYLENLSRNALALLKLASIGLMLRTLCST
ncbi:hypothetical protein MP213Fo_15690 [Pseudochrobactrum sp. MP213Fo]